MKAGILHSPGNILGEGPVSLSKKRLCWFDILGGRAYFLDIAENTVQECRLDNFICCAGITVKNEIIAAGATGIAVYNNNLQQPEILFSPPFNTKKLRFNDGKVGPDGAFWVGVMAHEGDKPIGMLLRITDKVECILESMLIPNGLGWSPDENTMYITDTGKGLISQWDFNSKTGQIMDEKTFVVSTGLKGEPDGLSVDASGNVWSAFWGGGRVYGFSPDGRVCGEIIVDAQNPTSCCFSGIDYSILYITSARHGIEKPGPSDGAVFRASTGTAGKSPYRFRY